MATLTRDSSSDSGSDSGSDSDVSYVPSDPYADARGALNAPMTVVDYTSKDAQEQSRQCRENEERAAAAAEAYREMHDPMYTSSDDDADTEIDDDAETEIDDDVEMAVVSLKY